MQAAPFGHTVYQAWRNAVRSWQGCAAIDPGGGVPDLRLQRYDGGSAAAMMDTLADIYEAEYAEAPYQGNPVFSREAFTERTGRQVHEHGFTLLSGSVDDEPVGYTFGYSHAPGRWLPGPCNPPPPEALIQAPRFFVVELIIRRPFRRRGYARQLMDNLLSDRAEPYAVLTAEPDAPARSIYPRWGWYEVCKMSGDAVTFDVLAKRLGI